MCVRAIVRVSACMAQRASGHAILCRVLSSVTSGTDAVVWPGVIAWHARTAGHASVFRELPDTAVDTEAVGLRAVRSWATRNTRVCPAFGLTGGADARVLVCVAYA